MVITVAISIIFSIFAYFLVRKENTNEHGSFKLFHYEKIKCPECAHEQHGKVEHTTPWWSYIHTCEKCNYVIMESEWNKT